FTDGLSLDKIEQMRQDILQLEFPKKGSLRTQLSLTGMFSDDMVLPPRPDIVAASFVMQVFGKTPELAPELVWTAISGDMAKGLTYLARLNHDAEVVLGIRTFRIRHWLAAAVRNEPGRSALLNPFFAEPPIPLGFLDAAIATTRTLLQAAPEEDERARLLNNLSEYLSPSVPSGY
ncbi:MAG: hypothetical protein Q7J73_08575, partial [Dehalococcoidales bacterium]|nr:hypothetical protein [Dehalococcoidales bacterium]